MLVGCTHADMFYFVSEIKVGFDALILAILTGCMVYLTGIYKKPKELVVLTFVVLLQYLALEEMVMFILVNLLAVAFGIYKIYIGNKDGDAKEVKQGIAIVLLLIAYRFLLAELDFATKSILFLITGAAFLIGAK